MANSPPLHSKLSRPVGLLPSEWKWREYKVFQTIRDTDTGKFIGFRDTLARVSGMTMKQCMSHAKDFVAEPVLEEVTK
jgi:hypothetical protein